MKPILLAAALLVLLEGILIIRLRHENQALHLEQAQVEQVRSDLAQAHETANANEAEARSLKSEAARLQVENEHTKSAALASSQTPPPSEEHVSPAGYGHPEAEPETRNPKSETNSNLWQWVRRKGKTAALCRSRRNRIAATLRPPLAVTMR
jgi:hypothetical protein